MVKFDYVLVQLLKQQLVFLQIANRLTNCLQICWFLNLKRLSPASLLVAWD